MSTDNSRVYLVVGGSGGIGAEVARQSTANGTRVIVTGRDAGRLAAIGLETGATTLELEARDSTAVDALLEQVLSLYGRLDGVVNCAGSILLKPAHLITDAEFAETIAINLITSFYVLRASVRHLMRQSNGGSIVLCSSVAARRGLLNHEAIAAAKAGVEGLALSAAASYARYQVRVNCVAPGLTRTGLTRALTQNEGVLKASSAMHPLGRIGEPAEVASAICWLLDSDQGWVTGQVIGVDGGLGKVQARVEIK
jgi:NAD(P)-dependent dehydrogenase (short-subunit alcohol dehydrogenase family)